MSQQQQGNNSSLDEGVLIAIMVLIAFAIVVAFIESQNARINAILGSVAWLHLLPFAFAANFIPALTEIPFFGNWIFNASLQAHDFFYNNPYSQMGPENRALVLKISGRAAILIYGGAMIYTMFRFFPFRPDVAYRTRHNLESMISLQAKHWPTSRNTQHVDARKIPDVMPSNLAKRVSQTFQKQSEERPKSLMLSGPSVKLKPKTWDRSLRPEEWIVAHGLAYDDAEFKRLTDPTYQPEEIEFTFRDTWERTNISSIEEVLTTQIKTPWTSAMDLPYPIRGLFAVMALFYSIRVDEGNKLLRNLALIADSVKYQPGKMADAILKEDGFPKYIDSIVTGEFGRKLDRIASNHAWVETALPRVLDVARTGRGVLSPPSFLWLKIEDRNLWYALNNMGNETSMAECSGAISHMKAEVQIGMPIRRKSTYQAARSMLEDYLDVTPERIKKRAEIRERSRKPGETIMMKLKGSIKDLEAQAVEAERSEEGIH